MVDVIEKTAQQEGGSAPRDPSFRVRHGHASSFSGRIPGPFEGKTYSLCGTGTDSHAYYESVRAFADDLLQQAPDLRYLLALVRKAGRRKHPLRRAASAESNGSIEQSLVPLLAGRFSRYTTNATSHLSQRSLAQYWDRTLSTSEEQYHCFMLEIELMNRLSVAEFRLCDTRLAFLPHCLHDLTADCRSAVRGEDYVCRGCSKICRINALSKLLRRHGVTPYIWMTANLRRLLRKLRKAGKRVGVLGVACIPELVSGMRKCAQAGVPVLGVPLDANRCARWWGEFHPNGLNIQELEVLLGRETLVVRRGGTVGAADGRDPTK